MNEWVILYFDNKITDGEVKLLWTILEAESFEDAEDQFEEHYPEYNSVWSEEASVNDLQNVIDNFISYCNDGVES